MCADPITLTVLAIGMGMSAYGTIQQGKAAKEAGKYQAKVAENNAKAAEYQAKDAALRGEIERDRLGFQGAAGEATGRTGFSAGNVLLDAGSSLAWQQDFNAGVATDKQIAQHNTDLEVWGLRNQASNYRAEGALAKYSGQQAYKSSLWQAGGTLLTTAGMVGLQGAGASGAGKGSAGSGKGVSSAGSGAGVGNGTGYPKGKV